ncbi:polysaccharide pyruvyl transferase WcaK-like protein [Paenibacillus endophyticus]|uniref:Polysaccharide pyruvyl transferase WcaK-like protein n=1 Tax=Paenibacillus endophyticus TaxID=1294268 RepID=A0A7W5GC51_9BACL|nr:polysaccharide pyruvyl transferase family protein [Paenibacillus endophyticus]MBB3154118.1 polysaccharide pyruvyl transferase WcaK-like protein [Paenibacillus endophyticus]
MKRILYVGWIGFNNVGDELMWLLFRDLCRAYLPDKKYDVIPSIPGVDIRNPGPYDTVVLGGGSLLIPGYIDVAYQAALKKKKVIVWGSGHDRQEFPVLDTSGKVEANLAYTAEHAETNEKLKELAKLSDFFGVRGPLSYQFLEDSGVSPKHAVISGDPAFLLPAPSPLSASKRSRTIGVNWGTAYNRIFGGSEVKVEQHMIESLRLLIAQGYRVNIFSVWGPDREACKRLYAKLGDPQNVELDLELHHHEDLLEKLKGYAFTINFKLHASYISAAAGVPFICLGYRFKCVDFGLSVDLSDYVLSTGDAQLCASIMSLAGRIEKERNTIRERFYAYQSRYREQLKRPFEEGLL